MIQIRAVIPIIVLASLAAFLLVSIAVQWDENDRAEQSRQLEYLDCVKLDFFGDVQTIDGPAEIVSFGGTDYVRLTDVGTLLVRTSHGSASYSVGPAHLKLVLLTGQSNSVYYTGPQYFQTEWFIQPGKAFFFGTPTSMDPTRGGAATPETVGDSRILDLVAPDGTMRMAQMYPEICRTWLSESEDRLLILNTGVGGQAIKEWDIPAGRCSAWMTTATDYLKKAIEEDGRIVIEPLAVLWSQGESDYRQTEEYYKERFEKLVERFKDGAWGYEYPYVLTSLPRYPGASNPIPPALAQIEVAEEDSAVMVASSLPLRFGADQTRDSIHYTQQAYGWLGEAFGRSMAEAYGVAPAKETIVMAEDVGTVSELPATVMAWGTSGASYELAASWTESEGIWTAELSGEPVGTRILQGLTATATMEE